MPCSRVTISKNYKCDKEGCFCVPTDGTSCICHCQNETGNITCCDCKCERSKYKCDDKCTCVNTGGYSCICACKEEKIKTCEKCSCVRRQRAVVSCKGNTSDVNCKCENAKCICLSTGEGSCICVCGDEKGNIKTCEGCSCKSKQETDISCEKKACDANCKCENTKCLISLSKGEASCICVCSDEKGNIKTCEGCSCKSKPEAVISCEKKTCEATCKCENVKCICLSTGEASCICICSDEKGIIKTCEGCSCKSNQEAVISCEKKVCDANCKCENANSICLSAGKASCICVCSDEKGNIKTCEGYSCKSKQEADISCEKKACDANCKCENAKCICLSTGRASCICVCSDEKINIKTCEGCSCKSKQEAVISCDKKACDANCKCENAKCICLSTGEASCICVCCEEKGNIRACKGCSCKSKKEAVISCNGKAYDVNCKCKNVNCICLSTGGDSCICVCSKESENIKTHGISSCTPSGVSYKATYAQAMKLSNDCKVSCKCDPGIASSYTCTCKNTQGEMVSCEDCKCDDNNNCDKKGCACCPMRSKNCCKTSAVSCISYVCKNKQEQINCCDNCKCVDSKTCDKEEFTCVTKDSTGEKEGKGKVTCVHFKSANSCICVCENKKGKLICCDDCKCDDSNTCDKTGCACISKVSNISNKSMYSKTVLPKRNCCCKSSVNYCSCICENKQGELVCCDDCKCDNKNTCDKKSCRCIPKESIIDIAETSKNTCVRFKSANPCSENTERKFVCCDDCKCDNNKTCNKEGCACVQKGSTTCIQTAPPKNKCCCKPSANSCVCLCDKKGEMVCCDDCKSDSNNTCDRQHCTCVPEGSVTCVKRCACAPKRSNTCICSN